MHEGNFTRQIVDSILAELAKRPDQKPQRVKVAVGEMLHLVPESVRAHYEIQTKGTRLEGAALELIETPVHVRCRVCCREGGVLDHHLLICSNCLSPDVELLKGRDVIVEEIELAR